MGQDNRDISQLKGSLGRHRTSKIITFLELAFFLNHAYSVFGLNYLVSYLVIILENTFYPVIILENDVNNKIITK